MNKNEHAMQVIELIEVKTHSEGGCTYSLMESRMLTAGEPLYLVSLHKELEEVYLLKEFSASDIRLFIISNSDLLWSPGMAIGTWVNEGKVYLDVTTVIDKRSCSVEDLKELVKDQIAGWDMETNEVIVFNND